MLNIRQSFFETNSSSCHALVFSNEAVEKLPKTVNFDNDDKYGVYLRQYINELNERGTKEFVNWLYFNGVTKIIYHGSNKYLNEYAKTFKDKFYEPDFPHSSLTSGALMNFINGHIDMDYLGHDDYLYKWEREEDCSYFMISLDG